MAILASLPGGPDDVYLDENGQKKPAPALKKYREFFAEALLRVGEHRFERAVDRCFRREHGTRNEDNSAVTAFYPTPDDFSRMIPAPPSLQPQRDCQLCHGKGYYYVRHCDCRKQNKTDTGLDGDADPRCIVCHGAGWLIDDEAKKNNRMKFCRCGAAA
jgi:hypothetical protein